MDVPVFISRGSSTNALSLYYPRFLILKLQLCVEMLSKETYQHMNMMHEIQGQESELHDKICVVDIRSFPFPCPFMVEVPEVNYIAVVIREKASNSLRSTNEFKLYKIVIYGLLKSNIYIDLNHLHSKFLLTVKSHEQSSLSQEETVK